MFKIVSSARYPLTLAARRCSLTLSVIFALGLLALNSVASASISSVLDTFFADEKLTEYDSVLVTRSGSSEPIYAWQADKQLIPASLVKLATAWLAIQQWGIEHRFTTEFYRANNTLWIKGYGDPFLVSEELEIIAADIQKHSIDLSWVNSIAVDNRHFKDQAVPGRTKVADPYNAPLSAVAVNFNTAQIANQKGLYVSTEPQTHLTRAAVTAAKQFGRPANGKQERINLMNLEYSKQHAAELFLMKLGLLPVAISNETRVPDTAELIFQHKNTRTLAENIRGMLEFSNNFIANQLFLMLVNQPQASFAHASEKATKMIAELLGETDFIVVEGAGLSRFNRFSAYQLNRLLTELNSHRHLLKQYDHGDAIVFAKTGTLNGVRSYAGYITVGEQEYQFVFNFNRAVPYRYRETLLKRLVSKLTQR